MNTSVEERNQIGYLTLRQLINSFPVAGPILNNIFFEYRNKIKQERINHFVGLLEAEFSKMDINPKTLQTEENLDLFENIFKKVTYTRSERKRVGLKNILINGIQNPIAIEYCELFAQMLLDIQSKELEILAFHRFYVIDGKGPLVKMNEVKAEANESGLQAQAKTAREPRGFMLRAMVSNTKPRAAHILTEELGLSKKLLEDYRQNCDPKKFNITKAELKSFLQNLLSKGLVRDDGVGTYETGDTEIMSITALGLKFLDFIKLS